MIDVQIILSIFALNISIIIWHMTLQQLKYIVAIDRYRNFAKAADACGISQPTLSAMLVKLEEELDVRIFERNNKNVQPTANGEQIIRQAERTLTEAERITWIVSEEKGKVAGELSLSVGPTIAPYILPKFIKHYVADFPQVTLSVKELKADAMLSELQLGHLSHQRQCPTGHLGDTSLHRALHGISLGELLAQAARVPPQESGA